LSGNLNLMANKYATHADESAESVANEKLRVSFEYVDWRTEEFFFHGMEQTYYEKFFSTITELKKAKEKEITQQTYYALSPKSIFNTTTSIKDSFPSEVLEIIAEQLYIETRDPQKSDEDNKEEARVKAKERLKRAFEISLGKNYGRIHGFVWNNVFNVVWFDPAHNLYPGDYGVTPHADAASVRCFGPDEVLRLQEKIRSLIEENAKLNADNEELLNAFANS